MSEEFTRNSQPREKVSQPHSDCQRNADTFYRMSRSSWMPSVEFEICTQNGKPFGSVKISDCQLDSIFDPQLGKNVETTKIKEYKNVTFVWGLKNKFKHSHPISFHQSQSDFSNELGSVYNLIRQELFKYE